MGSKDGMNQLSFKKQRNLQETEQNLQFSGHQRVAPGSINKPKGPAIAPFVNEPHTAAYGTQKPDNSHSPQKAPPKKAQDRMVHSESKHQKATEIKLTASLSKHTSTENLNLDYPDGQTASEDENSSKTSSNNAQNNQNSQTDQNDTNTNNAELKALKKEKKSLAYLLKVRAEIQKELDQRVSNCRALKKRVEELADEQQKLLPRLDRLEVELQSDLEGLE